MFGLWLLAHEFIGKVDEAWVPSSVFGSDTRSTGCADCSGTAGAIVGDGWHELMRTGQHVATSARVSWPFSLLTGVDYAGSFGIARDHAPDFSTGADAGYAAN